MNLLVYRTTPLKCGKSPFELVHGRKVRSNLPIVDDQLKVKSSETFRRKRFADKVKQKHYYDKAVRELPPLDRGDTVRIRDYRDKAWSTKGVVREEVSPMSYLIETGTGNVYRRNRQHVLKCTNREVVPNQTEDHEPMVHRNNVNLDRDHAYDETDVMSGSPDKDDDPTTVTTKSSRTVNKQNRLIEEM